jgi:type I restriction enzyme R subunit
MAMSINKVKLTETGNITKLILPAIKDADWDDMTQIRQEVKLREGKVIVRGQISMRKIVKSADIVLYHKLCIPHAVIETKVNEPMALCDQLKARLADSQTTQLHLTDAIVEQAV